MPDVRLLDGGMAAWEAAGLPLETGVRPVPPGNLTISFGSLRVVDAD
jgi:thiosulfate/3-mercaptopyruvate sulfurtransferase